MGLLATAIDGIQKKPPFLLLYGHDGIGKTSLLAQAPRSIFVGPENKTHRLKVKRIPGLDTFEKNVEILTELVSDKEHENVIFESVDWLDKMIFEKILKDSNSDSFNTAMGGWGAGGKELDRLTSKIISLLTKIWESGKGVYITGHYQLKEFADPNTSADYVRYILKTQRTETSALWRESVEGVFFLHYEVSKGKKDERAFTDGTRLIGTKWTTSFDAKDHFGVPDFIPMGSNPAEAWNNLQNALNQAVPDRVKQVSNEIESLKEKVTDKERQKKLEKIFKDAKEAGDIKTLETLLEQLKTIGKE